MSELVVASLVVRDGHPIRSEDGHLYVAVFEGGPIFYWVNPESHSACHAEIEISELTGWHCASKSIFRGLPTMRTVYFSDPAKRRPKNSFAASLLVTEEGVVCCEQGYLYVAWLGGIEEFFWVKLQSGESKPARGVAFGYAWHYARKNEIEGIPSSHKVWF